MHIASQNEQILHQGIKAKLGHDVGIPLTILRSFLAAIPTVCVSYESAATVIILGSGRGHG